ncbi:MAG: CARDB domain-containing protein [Bacteroidota bacterium]
MSVTLMAQTAIKSSVFSNGSVNASSASYKLNGLVGEGLVGQSSSASYTVRAGFALSPAERFARSPDSERNSSTGQCCQGRQNFGHLFSKNIGDVAASGAITVKAYLSTNSVIDAQDVVLATLDCGTDLAVNATVAFPVGLQDNNLTIPGETLEQSYQVLLMVDPANTIVEKNETNNVNTNALLLDVTNASSGGGGPDVAPPIFGALHEAIVRTGRMPSLRYRYPTL